MRVAGRQKGSKIKAYTHVTVNPNAPKSRYTFSMHSSEAGAKKAAEKYSKHIPGGLDIIKKTGKSTKTDYFNEEDTSMEEKNKGLWHNIHMKRKRGEKMRKKGDPGAPTQAALKSAQGKTEDMTSTASIPNPADTAMGPRIKTTTMHDKRRKKDQFPVLLKRFRKYIEDNG